MGIVDGFGRFRVGFLTQNRAQHQHLRQNANLGPVEAVGEGFGLGEIGLDEDGDGRFGNPEFLRKPADHTAAERTDLHLAVRDHLLGHVDELADADATADVVLKRVLDVSKGGLVVFGSLIGGLGAALVYCYFRKAPFLAIADLIAPSLVLGLAIGRIGCLMNGCCYGSVCDQPWALEFPAGENAGTQLAAPTSPSPPYAHQLGLGQLHGFRIGEDDGKIVVREVVPGSAADKGGLRQGDVLLIINQLRVDKPLRREDGRLTSAYSAAQSQLQELHRAHQRYAATKQGPPPELIVVTADDRKLDLTLRDERGAPTLPAVSRPVHPTQIYAAVNGALLTLLLLAYYPFRRHDGEVIALLLTLYPITRIAEEMIRDDESKSYFLGIMTISQAISAGLLIAAGLLWIYVLTRPAGSALPPEGSVKAAA